MILCPGALKDLTVSGSGLKPLGRGGHGLRVSLGRQREPWIKFGTPGYNFGNDLSSLDGYNFGNDLSSLDGDSKTDRRTQ